MPKPPSTRSRNRTLLAALLALAGVLATACGSGVRADDDERKRVVTTFTVLADMARNVAGDAVAVESITKPGAEIHTYEPTPSDMLTAAKADLVLDNGLGLERWFAKFVERSEAEHVTLTSDIKTIPIRGGDYDGAANPHAWMSPDNAQTYVAAIRDALIRLAPEHADTFRTNAENYSRRIDEIGRHLRAELATVPDAHRALVTCEGAFSYLARDAGLREAYLWPVNSESEGTPQQIKNTTRFVRDNGIPTLFCESTVNDSAQRQVADETGARLGTKLYVDSLSRPDGPVPTYLALLRHDAAAIVEGLSGGTR
ncbi:metal ABC transporter substrate-binding protein [Parasphingorhabdus pacifica]